MPTLKPLLGLLVLVPTCLADTLRVTTWDLQAPNGVGTNEIRLQEVAAALKQISPDVILLQQVRDWKMCSDLVQALMPDQYTIQICSAFREAGSGALSTRQVAILSKGKAYFSWSEAWRPQDEAALPGGFVFAALQIGSQRVGFFSVQAGAASADAHGPAQRSGIAESQAVCVGQLLQQVASAGNWGANRVQEFVVGATFNTRAAGWAAARDNTLRLLEAAGFDDALFQTPAAEKVTAVARSGQPGATADHILVQPAGCSTNARVLTTTVGEHYPVSCEVELDPARVASALASRAEALRTRESQAAKPLQPAVAVTQLSIITHQKAWVAAAFGAIAALAASIWLVARRTQSLGRQTPALLTAGADIPSSFTVVVGTRTATEAASANPPPPPREPQPLIHIETQGDTHTQTEALRQRAMAAEQRAERATAVIRAGLIPHLSQWLKQNLVRKLMADRSQLLETQQAAAQKAMAVEERLSRIEQQIQRQNAGYQARIEALTRDLIVAKEENRELIRARIVEVKLEMEAARTRLMARSNADEEAGA